MLEILIGRHLDSSEKLTERQLKEMFQNEHKSFNDYSKQPSAPWDCSYADTIFDQHLQEDNVPSTDNNELKLLLSTLHSIGLGKKGDEQDYTKHIANTLRCGVEPHQLPQLYCDIINNATENERDKILAQLGDSSCKPKIEALFQPVAQEKKLNQQEDVIDVALNNYKDYVLEMKNNKNMLQLFINKEIDDAKPDSSLTGDVTHPLGDV